MYLVVVAESRDAPLNSGEDRAALQSQARWLVKVDGRGGAPVTEVFERKKKKERR